MTTIVVTTKGQVVIPARIRRKLHIKKGTKLYVEEINDGFILKPMTSEYLRKVPGVLQTKGKLSKVLLTERAKDKKREV